MWGYKIDNVPCLCTNYTYSFQDQVNVRRWERGVIYCPEIHFSSIIMDTLRVKVDD